MSTTAAAPPVFLRTGFVNVQGPAVKFRPVQRFDRAIAFGIHAHFHEAEAARLTGLAIGHNADAVHGPICFKHRPQCIFGRPEAEVSYKNVFQVSIFLNLQSELIGQIEQRR